MLKKFQLPRLHWFLYFLIGVFLFSWIYLFLAYGLAFILPVHKVGNTSVSGLLVRNQVWEGEILIVGDTLSTPGTKVEIKPGTVVKIAHRGDKFNLNWLPWLLKGGINTGLENRGIKPGEPFWDEKEKIQLHFSTLQAIGTKEQPIVFDSNAQYPSPYDVNVISAKHGLLAHVVMAHYRRFEIANNFSIRDSVFREVGECAVCINQGNVSLFNSTFEQALRESVWVEGGSPRITNNQFLNLSGGGVILDPQRFGKPVVSNNVFEMPEQDALVLLTGLDMEPGLVSLNKFSGNSTIKIACDSRIHFSQNIISGLISFTGNCGGEYIFGPNFWGTNDARTILVERILNKGSEFKVSIPTLLTVPPPGVGNLR
jgi:hypothetical protein